MKTTNLLKIGFLALTTTFFMACGGGEGSHDETDQTDSTETSSETASAEKVTYSVDTSSSAVEWKGKMLGGLEFGEVTKAHFGTLNFTEGTVEMSGNDVVGGSFTVDMTSIIPKDENYNEDYTSEKLVGHLMSNDFFNTKEHPTSSLEILSVEGTTATATLTIRGKSGEVEITDIVVAEEGSNKVITGSLVFDRQNYDVSWSNPAEDLMLSDDISLDVRIVASK